MYYLKSPCSQVRFFKRKVYVLIRICISEYFLVVSLFYQYYLPKLESPITVLVFT